MTALSEDLIAIAVGTRTGVAGWSILLRAEAIDSVIAASCQEAVEDEPDHDELWVHKDDAEHAKSILRALSCKNGPSPW